METGIQTLIASGIASEIHVDAETNGLGGHVFALHADAYNIDGKKVAVFTGRCPIEGGVNDWVAENVVTNLQNMEENFNSEQELLAAYAQFHKTYRFADDKADANPWERKNTLFFAHMPAPVETNAVYDRMVELELLGSFDRPYGWMALEAQLELLGEDPGSSDNYVKKYDLKVDFEGVTHHPGYDCAVCKAVRDHLKQRVSEMKARE